MTQPGRRPASKNRPQARKGRTAAAAKTARKGTDRTAWIVAGVVILVGVALVFVFAQGDKSSPTDPIKGRQPASAALVKSVTEIPGDVTSQVGAGSVTHLPTKLPGDPELKTADGKPRIIYVGAEYCPYCATERWSMVNALSRFGTFSNLQITTSATNAQNGAPEALPNTPTFSFHGSKYTSDYISWEPTEEFTNKFEPLETKSAEVSQLMAKFDAPPFVDEQSTGAIPFVNFANEYIISGASYGGEVLSGKTHAQVGEAMGDPSSDIAKGAIGAANVITATICATTDNKPANVCSDPAIQAIQSQLPTEPPTAAE